MHLGWWVVIGVLMAGLGGGGMWLVAATLWPNPATEAMFLGLLALTLAGLTLPVAALLNQRFARPGWQAQDPYRLLRQGGWVGLFGGLCGWLQAKDVLNWIVAAVVGAVLLLMEAFFLTRDRE